MQKLQFSSKYALLALALFFIEVIIATYLKHFTFIRNYFGDFLVVILLYCMAKTLYPFKAKRLAIGIFIFACLIETLQYFHIADLLNLQKDGIARIVTGTQFGFEDIAMYAGGCVLVWLLDTHFCQK